MTPPHDPRSFTRREALRAAAGTAGAAILGGCAVSTWADREDPAPRVGAARVVIVGAGLAGLHCARRLKGLGVVAEVREAAGRAGGRVFTDHQTFGDQSCELGGEFIDRCHATMLDLAQELDLELLDFDADESILEPWLARVGGLTLGKPALYRGLEGLARVDSRTDPALDRTSIHQRLDEAGLRGDLRSYVEGACRVQAGLEPEDASAVQVLGVIRTATGGPAVAGAIDRRFRFRAGNEILAERMSRDLDPGQLRFASRLVRIRRDPDGRLRLTFDRGTVMGAEEVVTDHAVLSLPFSLLREVEIELDLPPVKRRAIAELGYGTHAKIAAGFRERPWRDRGSAGGVLTDLPFQCAWDGTRMQPGRGGVLVNLTGGRRGIEVGTGSTATRAQEFVDGINRVFPGAADAYDRRAVRMHWPTHPWSKGSVSAYRVGQWAAFGGHERDRVGNLHFCGEHTSVNQRGTMEGAVLTGAMAALEVAGDLGIAVPPGNPILDRARAG